MDHHKGIKAPGPSISAFSMFILKSNPCCLLSLFFLTSPAPTLPPTTLVPSTTPSDECDDDQASCHSGTGDDYDVTGANIALMRLQATPLSPSRPSFCYGSHSIRSTLPASPLSVTLRFDTVANLPSTVHTCTHACMHPRPCWHVRSN